MCMYLMAFRVTLCSVAPSSLVASFLARKPLTYKRCSRNIISNLSISLATNKCSASQQHLIVLVTQTDGIRRLYAIGC